MAYVCANCGYFELYIDDTIKLAQISEHWERAHGQN
jgi:predicted nucleic-acid-binding Zn-ribbon protein